MADQIILVFISAFVGFALAEIRNFISHKRNRVESTVSKYVERIREVGNEESIKLEVMARSGVIKLNKTEFRRFTERVIEEGCIHPFKDTVLDGGIKEGKIPDFLRVATQDSVILSDEAEVLRYYLQISDVVKYQNQTNNETDIHS